MTPTQIYLAESRRIFEKVAAQEAAIGQASDWFAETILRGRMVHLFGSGHSRMMTEEMWPRYGSFPG
ncbi:MAG: SIS domain-containing protein, partial [Puniceicoccaceae bacterium]